MTTERYQQLMADDSSELTASETSAGWHFCFSWDGLLVGPGMDEVKFCECEKREER